MRSETQLSARAEASSLEQVGSSRLGTCSAETSMGVRPLSKKQEGSTHLVEDVAQVCQAVVPEVAGKLPACLCLGRSRSLPDTMREGAHARGTLLGVQYRLRWVIHHLSKCCHHCKGSAPLLRPPVAILPHCLADHIGLVAFQSLHRQRRVSCACTWGVRPCLEGIVPARRRCAARPLACGQGSGENRAQMPWRAAVTGFWLCTCPEVRPNAPQFGR